MAKQTSSPPSLYGSDETAWLECTATLLAERRFSEIDHQALAEYLTDMARRDKREVASRITILMAHLLKWEHQPAGRCGSWHATILLQKNELADLLESLTLRNHAEEILQKCYERAVKRAAAETLALAPQPGTAEQHRQSCSDQGARA